VKPYSLFHDGEYNRLGWMLHEKGVSDEELAELNVAPYTEVEARVAQKFGMTAVKAASAITMISYIESRYPYEKMDERVQESLSLL
jgi:hypothetical protein